MKDDRSHCCMTPDEMQRGCINFDEDAWTEVYNYIFVWVNKEIRKECVPWRRNILISNREDLVSRLYVNILERFKCGLIDEKKRIDNIKGLIPLYVKSRCSDYIKKNSSKIACSNNSCDSTEDVECGAPKGKTTVLDKGAKKNAIVGRYVGFDDLLDTGLGGAAEGEEFKYLVDVEFKKRLMAAVYKLPKDCKRLIEIELDCAIGKYKSFSDAVRSVWPLKSEKEFSSVYQRVRKRRIECKKELSGDADLKDLYFGRCL